MMTKPPSGLASSNFSENDDDESIDDSLDEILLEATEKPLENPTRPPDNPRMTMEYGAPAVSVSPSPSLSPSPSSTPLPLPGLPRAHNEVTALSPRPSFLDDDDDDEPEEETKVEPYETAVRAAASKGIPEAGLATQASDQRDKALRRSIPVPPPPRMPVRSPLAQSMAEVEFEEADDSDASDYTPTDIPISDEEADLSGGYEADSPFGGLPSRLPPPGRSSTPPLGRPDLYSGRRIPTPSSDFMPAQSAYGSGSSYPSVPIPAPAGDTGVRARPSARLSSVIQLPMPGLAAFVAAAFAGGVLVGALIWRGGATHDAAPSIATVRTMPKAEPAAVVVQPVPSAAAAQAAPAVEPTAAAPTVTAIDPPLGATRMAADETRLAVEQAPAARPARRPARPKKVTVGALGVTRPDTLPSKPKRATGTTTAWQDPFAQ